MKRRNINIDQTKFSILQYTDHYIAQKRCSITGELVRVRLTIQEFHNYYLPKGKNISHLTHLSEDNKLFLESTLTPAEVAKLTVHQKRLSKKLWKREYKNYHEKV